MELFKEKKYLYLVMVAVLLWAGSAVSEINSSSESMDLSLKKSDSISNGGSGLTPPQNDDKFDPGKAFAKMMGTVLLVIVLGIGVLYLSKKILPKMSSVVGKKIHILETASIGPRRYIHLVEVGGQQILIGSTNETVTKLADITAADEDHKLPEDNQEI